MRASSSNIQDAMKNTPQKELTCEDVFSLTLEMRSDVFPLTFENAMRCFLKPDLKEMVFSSARKCEVMIVSIERSNRDEMFSLT